MRGLGPGRGAALAGASGALARGLSRSSMASSCTCHLALDVFKLYLLFCSNFIWYLTGRSVLFLVLGRSSVRGTAPMFQIAVPSVH